MVLDGGAGRPQTMRLLAVWLIATGLLHFVSPPFPYATPALAVLAVAAGVLLLLDR